MDGEVIIGDAGQSGITGGEGGKMTEVLEEADERVLVVIVHVGDDANLRSFFGGRAGHVRGTNPWSDGAVFIYVGFVYSSYPPLQWR